MNMDNGIEGFGLKEKKDITEIDLHMQEAITKALASKSFKKHLEKDFKNVMENYSKDLHGISDLNDKIYEEALKILHEYIEYNNLSDTELREKFSRSLFKDNIERIVYDTCGEDLPEGADGRDLIKKLIS
jgi:hypothetical protein